MPFVSYTVDLSLRARRLVGVVVLLGLAAGASHGQSDTSAPDGMLSAEANADESVLTLPLLLADGTLAIPATLYNSAGAKDPVSLELALDYPGTLEVQADQFEWLKVPLPEPGVAGLPLKLVLGEAAPVTVMSGDIGLIDRVSRVDRQNALTVQYASALQERKLKGRIGLGFLRRYHVEIDVHARQLRLTPAGKRAGSTPLGEVEVSFDPSAPLLALPVEGVDGARVVLGSAQVENRLLPSFAGAAVRPPRLAIAGAPELNLAAGFAWRLRALVPPRDALERDRVRLPLPPRYDLNDLLQGVVAVTGTDFLDAYHVEIDWTAGRVGFTARRGVVARADHQAYFDAETAGTTEALQAFLRAYPESYFARQAAGRLLEERLREFGVSDEEVLEALRWVAETALPERRTELCLAPLARLSGQPGKEDLVVAGGKLALTYSRAASHIQDVYRIHRLIGTAYVKRGDWDQAWRHLMSASFVKIEGDPDHAFLCPFYLAQVYEQQGRSGRAYSRYRAALAVRARNWAPPPALKLAAEQAIERLRESIPAEQLKELDAL